MTFVSKQHAVRTLRVTRLAIWGMAHILENSRLFEVGNEQQPSGVKHGAPWSKDKLYLFSKLLICIRSKDIFINKESMNIASFQAIV